MPDEDQIKVGDVVRMINFPSGSQSKALHRNDPLVVDLISGSFVYVHRMDGGKGISGGFYKSRFAKDKFLSAAMRAKDDAK